MPITLEQAKLNTQEAVAAAVIDEFRKSSFILENMTFDDAVVMGSGEATLTYGYKRIITQPTASFRALNTEYIPQEVQKQKVTTELKIFGGSFEVDRITQETSGNSDEVSLQIGQKVKAARSLFHDTCINGDSAVDENCFDGLNKAVAGSTTEYGVGKYIDLSTSAAVDENWKVFLDELDAFLALLDGKPAFLGGNSKLITKIKAVARRAGYLTQTEDAFGRKADSYDGIILVDLGEKPGSNDPIVPIASRNIGALVPGLTDLYAARLAMDGFHGVTLKGKPFVRIYLPDFLTPGAVKKGEVEMVASVALKATKSAGVFRNIKVL